jgi:hypothetical protein
VNNVRWRIAGDEVVSCNCAWGCPCQFNGLPTNGRCEGVAAFEIHEGHFGEVGLGGVRFARIYSWPASIPEGNGTRLTIIDDRAAADQRSALVALDSAKHGGLYFEIFASVCPNLLEPIFAPLEIATNRGKRRAQVIILMSWRLAWSRSPAPLAVSRIAPGSCFPTVLNSRRQRWATLSASRLRCRANSRCVTKIATRSLTLSIGATGGGRSCQISFGGAFRRV